MSLSMSKVGAYDIRSWSAGTRAPLLYLHGFEQHPGDAPFLKTLAKSHTVMAPEHPGYGESTGIEDISHILDVSLHFRELVENWGKGPVDVVGHSLGGMFAAEFAATSPHLVRRLVLVAPYGVWLDEEPALDPFVLPVEVMKKAKWHDPNAADGETSVLTEGDVAERMIFRVKNLGSASKFMWPIPDRGLSRRLRYIKAPTLVIRGASDGLVPASYAQTFVDGIPGARLKQIAAAGHLPMVEQPEAFLAAVEEFLN
jgi:pimeloyl-ACP methyl ester carboxylesterase